MDNFNNDMNQAIIIKTAQYEIQRADYFYVVSINRVSLLLFSVLKSSQIVVMGKSLIIFIIFTVCLVLLFSCNVSMRNP